MLGKVCVGIAFCLHFGVSWGAFGRRFGTRGRKNCPQWDQHATKSQHTATNVKNDSKIGPKRTPKAEPLG